ncbi:MAG: methyltransferase domain-containing protein [Actinomycetota bacterium]|nr:methyltransferase domain-containing protein [Actinomycetota bacterium]
MPFDGQDYQARFDAIAASGTDVHGEGTFVRSLLLASGAGPARRPRSVLDAGCGTGRVAIELAGHGIDVVGVDVDASMIAEARRRAPTLSWIEADLAGLHLGRTFDVVVLAGNVPLFTQPATERALVVSCAAHVGGSGALVAGFQLDRTFGLDDYDASCAAAGFALAERWATWDRAPFAVSGEYAVSVHRRNDQGGE